MPAVTALLSVILAVFKQVKFMLSVYAQVFVHVSLL